MDEDCNRCKKCGEPLIGKYKRSLGRHSFCQCWEKKLGEEPTENSKGKRKRPKYPQIKTVPYGEGIEELAQSVACIPGQSLSEDGFRSYLDQFDLPERDKRIIYLHLYEEWSFQDLADEFGMAKSSAAYEYHRIIAKLREEKN